MTVEGTVELLAGGSADWQAARPNQVIRIGDRLRTGRQSRATVMMADLSVIRVNELTLFALLPPLHKDRKPLLDFKNGSIYFFSREKPADVQFRTPTASGAIRGTEFYLAAVEDRETLLVLVDGEVDLGNDLGTVTLRSGEQALVEQGKPPVKTAMIDAVSILQWCLYYPGVVDPDEIRFTDQEKEIFRASLAAYRTGDLLKAIELMPAQLPPPTEASLVYRAALQLSVGRVDLARQLLRDVPVSSRLAEALREMIAAVQGTTWQRSSAPVLASEWVAESYYQQSRAQLDEALKSALAAAAQAPAFGFAWARAAELQFSFARSRNADAALAKGLQYSPRNPQALALKGFIMAAQGNYQEAQGWFDRAIEVDGALGNAWLGRGLCRIRAGEAEQGRKDLQVAATLEPNRALLRSYLGKAFSHTGKEALADKELRLARKLDPKDPTAWLYAALLNHQRNRVNEAIRDLEKSQELNRNQAVFRSSLLLDHDQAVRSANLASIYQDAGMGNVSFREAAKAVNYDYANYSAHLFLAESYDSMRDPKLYNLRYETPARSEWLMANILSPVGAGVISRYISQQDYALLFEKDRVGISSKTDYFSSGEWYETGSQYGRYGKVAYSLDAYYHSDPGQRPNNDLEQTQLSAQIKAHVTQQDTLFLLAESFEMETGDVLQYYDPQQYHPSLRVKETQEPNLYLGYHHEWNPGAHTLFLAGWLQDTLEQTAGNVERSFFKYGRGPHGGVTSILPRPYELAYQRDYEAWSGELQQVFQSHRQALILGSRYQAGDADTTSHLQQKSPAAGWTIDPIQTDSLTDMQRFSAYSYYQLQIWEPLRLTAGLSYDWLHYPQNVDSSPISGLETSRESLSPKAGLYYTPWTGGTFRGMYSRSLGGFLHENSLQLEPTQIAGFNQVFRSLIPESAEGLTPGAKFQVAGLGFDQKLPTGTYLGVSGHWAQSDGPRWIGAVSSTRPFVEPNLAYSARQSLDFEEKALQFTANQLLSEEWSLGLAYRLSEANLEGRFPEVRPVRNASHLQLTQDDSATLQTLDLFVIYNHRCGFFGEFHSVWMSQSNDGYSPARPGDDFWQQNIFLGYRFPRRKAEIRLGVVNLTGQDYRLNPLNLYSELPRERMFTASARFTF